MNKAQLKAKFQRWEMRHLNSVGLIRTQWQYKLMKDRQERRIRTLKG